MRTEKAVRMRRFYASLRRLVREGWTPYLNEELSESKTMSIFLEPPESLELSENMFSPTTAVCYEQTGDVFDIVHFLSAGRALGFSASETHVLQAAEDYVEFSSWEEKQQRKFMHLRQKLLRACGLSE